MKVINTIPEMRAWREQRRKAGKTIGFVPTMGYLHQGHLSLVEEAHKHADEVVVSIYVNPTQFGPNEDLDRYPRDFARDEALCRQHEVAAVFYPSDTEMYGPDHKTYVVTDELSAKLCGRSRPTHFRGVTTIVAKLFNIIQPEVAVFGQKDAQQAIIIRRMIKDLNFDVRLIVAPIVREPDGLAMSSRNKYLNADERKQATVLHQSLKLAEQEFAKGNRNLDEIKRKMQQLIASRPLARIDYIEAVDALTLGEPKPGERDVLVALAVFFGKTRLIDNTILNGS